MAEAPRRRPGRPRRADAAANREVTPGASGSSGSGWEAQEARGTAAGAAVGKPHRPRASQPLPRGGTALAQQRLASSAQASRQAGWSAARRAAAPVAPRARPLIRPRTRATPVLFCIATTTYQVCFDDTDIMISLCLSLRYSTKPSYGLPDFMILVYAPLPWPSVSSTVYLSRTLLCYFP